MELILDIPQPPPTVYRQVYRGSESDRDKPTQLTQSQSVTDPGLQLQRRKSVPFDFFASETEPESLAAPSEVHRRAPSTSPGSLENGEAQAQSTC